MALPTTAEVLNISSVCQFLAHDDEKKQLLRRGFFLRQGLWRMIYAVREGIQWLFDTYPSDTTLPQKTTYLYWLCTPYIAQAESIIDGGGSGTIVNPSTGTASTVTAYELQFTVGDVGAPMNAGDTVLVLNYTDFITNSVKAFLDGTRTPQNLMTQISCNIVYNPTNVTITWNQGVQNGQTYIIDGLRLQPVVQPAASETFFEVATYAQMQALAGGSYYRAFLVLNDENKGQTNTRYEYWPDSGIKEWIAAVEEP